MIVKTPLRDDDGLGRVHHRNAERPQRNRNGTMAGGSSFGPAERGRKRRHRRGRADRDLEPFPGSRASGEAPAKSRRTPGLLTSGWRPGPGSGWSSPAAGGWRLGVGSAGAEGPGLARFQGPARRLRTGQKVRFRGRVLARGRLATGPGQPDPDPVLRGNRPGAGGRSP